MSDFKMNASLMTEIVDLYISNVAYKGKGIGYHKKKIVFVQNAIQKDYLKIKITKEKPTYSEAEKISLIEKNPLRQKKSCSYADKCGGCNWSDVNQDHQLILKQTFIKDAFSHIAKLDMDRHPIVIYPAPKKTHYRNRINLRGRILKDGSIIIGFFKKNSQELVRIESCQISHHALNQVISKLNTIKLGIQSEIIPFRLELQVLYFNKKQNSPHIFAVFHSIQNTTKLDALIDKLKQLPHILWAGYDYKKSEAPIGILEKDTQLTYHTSPGVFQQVNTPHNQNLRRYINRWIEKIDPINILDLYCGSGNISLMLANGKRSILGVEINKESIRLAKLNVTFNHLKRIDYLASSVTKYLVSSSRKNLSFDCIILDPPRKGAKDDLASIINLSPKHIIYISCDPTTCARDLLILKADYSIIDIAGFDFFPDTYHIETVVILKKKYNTV